MRVGILFIPRIENVVTTTHGSPPAAEVCARIKHFGYAVAKKIRIYGEEFTVLSDPFPSDGGIAIHVRSHRTSQTRILQLPATIIHREHERFARAA